MFASSRHSSPLKKDGRAQIARPDHNAQSLTAILDLPGGFAPQIIEVQRARAALKRANCRFSNDNAGAVELSMLLRLLGDIYLAGRRRVGNGETHAAGPKRIPSDCTREFPRLDRLHGGANSVEAHHRHLAGKSRLPKSLQRT